MSGFQVTPKPIPASLFSRLTEAETDVTEIRAEILGLELGGGVPVVHAAAYGVDEAEADNRTFIVAAAAAIQSLGGGGTLLLPEGTLDIGRSGTTPYSIDLVGENLVIQGVPGKTVLRHVAGMSGEQCSMIRADLQSNLTFRDIIFDGNWGATEGVTTDTASGNHTTQVDPKNHGIALRGATDILIENCTFRQMYGDGVWLGISSNDDPDSVTRRVKIINCTFDLCARNGVTLGQAQDDVTIERCTFTNIWTTAIDSEPQSFIGRSRNINVLNNDIGVWWDPTGGGSACRAISCVGGYTSGNNQASAVRGWRIIGNRLYGNTHIDTAVDVIFSQNRVVYDFASGDLKPVAPVLVDHGCDDVIISDNYIYDNGDAGSFSSHTHDAAIHVQNYGSGNANYQPAGVRVLNNSIHVRKGLHGVMVMAQGGFAIGDATAVVAPVSGTATSTSANTLADTGKSWTTNQWAGWTVRCGGVVGLVASNTATVLTIVKHTILATGWYTPLGELTATPTAGAYVITSLSGVCEVSGNHIDCGTDGNAAGAYGIYVFNDRAGARVVVHDNKIKNATGWGVYVAGATSKPALYVQITENKFWDDQASVTMSAGIRFSAAASLTSIVKLVMRGNSMIGGATTLLSGVSAGTWLINDGLPQQWTGYGAPADVVVAPIGSTYVRIDGGASTTLYVKEATGTTAAGWVAK